MGCHLGKFGTLAIGSRRPLDAVSYPLRPRLFSQPGLGAWLRRVGLARLVPGRPNLRNVNLRNVNLRNLGLGGTFVAAALVTLLIAGGIAGVRLSVALAARSDAPPEAMAKGPRLAYGPSAEIDLAEDVEELPPLLSPLAFNAGAFEPDDRSLLDPFGLVEPVPFERTPPDYARVNRFEPNPYREEIALAPVDHTPLPRRRPRLAALTPFDGIPAEDNFFKTAIYDISSKVVYMPNGDRLEAHSGLGPKMDDPRHVHVRMHGATPPNTYRLTMREKLFHGTEAIRLTPIGDGNMYGRAGILAHPYLLGPNGQSNGCVSLKDYPKFLAAFKRGEVQRIVVVSKLDQPPAFAKPVQPESKFASLMKLFGVQPK